MKKNHLSDRIKQLRIGNYFRELSVVIIGVAITLYVSNQISSAKEQNDMKLQLSAIYTEMEDNLKRVDELYEYYEMNRQLRKYLLESINNPQPTTNDSIRKYQNVAWGAYSQSFKKGAYEMFINTGSMKMLEDKNLLLDITESYTMLETVLREHELRVNTKLQLFQKTYTTDKEILYKEEGMDILSPQNNHIFNYHSLNSGTAEYVEVVKEQIEKLLTGKLRSYSQDK